MYDNWQKQSCAFYFPENEYPEPGLQSGQFALDKFKQCLQCKHFETYGPSYRCNHIDGKNCLLQIGINKFEAK